MNMNERKIEINTQGGALITGGVFIGTQFIANNPVKNERIETFSLNEKNSQDEELKFKNEESHPDKDSPLLPDIFNTPQAGELLERLMQANLLNEDWQPVNLSNTEKGVLAQYIAGQLNLKMQWKTFSRLWNMRPEALRKAYNQGMEQRKTLDFLDRITHK